MSYLYVGSPLDGQTDSQIPSTAVRSGEETTITYEGRPVGKKQRRRQWVYRLEGFNWVFQESEMER